MLSAPSYFANFISNISERSTATRINREEEVGEREHVNSVSLAARFYPGFSEIPLNLMKVDGRST